MIKLEASKASPPSARHRGSRTLARKTPSNKAFASRVYKVVRGIKRGQTLSYMEVAKRAGSPRAYRAVGNILTKNFDPAIPCHRVIRADGQSGGYNRGRTAKIKLLEKERAARLG